MLLLNTATFKQDLQLYDQTSDLVENYKLFSETILEKPMDKSKYFVLILIGHHWFN